MQKFLSTGVVDAIKAEAGSEFVTVTFAKVDGTIRTMNGQFNTGKHMVGGEAGAAASARNKAAGLTPLWVPAEANKAGGRSFKTDRVLSVTTKRRTYMAT